MAKKKRLTAKAKKAAFRKELRKKGLLAKKERKTPICPVCQKPCPPSRDLHPECVYKAFYDEMFKVFMKYFPHVLMMAAMPFGAGIVASLAAKSKKSRRKGKGKS